LAALAASSRAIEKLFAGTPCDPHPFLVKSRPFENEPVIGRDVRPLTFGLEGNNM
jgi:hypothetical protein